MRRVVSTMAAVLAAVVLPLALTAVWTAERVTDADGYVAAVGPLAGDREVQEALTDRLEQYAAELVGLDSVPGEAQRALRGIIRGAVEAAVTSPAFRPLWEEANRAGHGELVRTLRADQAGAIRPLELTVILDSVVDSLRAQGVPLGVADPPGLVLTPDRGQLRAAQEGYQALDDSRTWLPAVWAGLVLLTLLVARRRARALAVLAGASVLSVALMWPVLAGLRSAAVRATAAADRELAGAVWDGVTRSLESLALLTAVIAGAVLVLALLLDRTGVQLRAKRTNRAR